MKNCWRLARAIRNHEIPAEIYPLISHQGSLTDHLAKYCPGNFNLQLLHQAWQRPLADERNILSIPEGRFALIREIFLQCDKAPMVYGRSIIPAKFLRGPEKRLAFLGQRSLGDYLFSQPHLYRSQIEISRIPLPLYLSKHLTGMKPGETLLWARRSIFCVHDKPLLVVEIFLPGIEKCIQKK